MDSASDLKPPNGLSEIISTFGDLAAYIDDTGLLLPTWNLDYLTVMDLPFEIPLAWDKSVVVDRMTCHKLMVPIFAGVFKQIEND